MASSREALEALWLHPGGEKAPHNIGLEKRSAEIQQMLNEETLDDRLSSLEEELVKKKIGGKIINRKKPIEVFDNPDEDKPAQSFEIDEIKKVENKKKLDVDNSEPKKKEVVELHEDDDDTSRIGRAGDLFKRKKV